MGTPGTQWAEFRGHYIHCYFLDDISVRTSLVYPLARCNAFNISVACPHDAPAFLREIGYGPCLALPAILPTRDCTHPWNRHLRSGWSAEDASRIVSQAQRLSRDGFASFVAESQAHCANHSIVDELWWHNCLSGNDPKGR